MEPLAEALLAGFDREIDGTRRMFERVPDDRIAWKPHARSIAMGTRMRG